MHLMRSEKLQGRQFGYSGRGEISFDKRKPTNASDIRGLSDVTRATRPTKKCQPQRKGTSYAFYK
jgi:hypothetical protein